MSAFPEGKEPTDSTKIELKADDPNQKEITPIITPQIDEEDKTDLHMDKILELRGIIADISENYSDRDCERFLIARNFNMTKVEEMIRRHYNWYNTPVGKDFQIENKTLRPRDMGLNEVDNKQEMFNQVFPCSNLGWDKEGHPIYWEKSGYGRPHKLSSVPLLHTPNLPSSFPLVASNWKNIRKNFTHDELTARHIRQQELMRQRCRTATLRNGRPIEKGVVVMDMKGVPIFVEWACFKSLKEVIGIDEAFYPETLRTLFVINAPVYFTALWAIVKPWLDPLTLQKIQILGEDFYPTLSKYISEETIPVELGGKKADFSWVQPTNFID